MLGERQEFLDQASTIMSATTAVQLNGNGNRTGNGNDFRGCGNVENMWFKIPVAIRFQAHI